MRITHRKLASRVSPSFTANCPRYNNTNHFSISPSNSTLPSDLTLWPAPAAHFSDSYSHFFKSSPSISTQPLSLLFHLLYSHRLAFWNLPFWFIHIAATVRVERSNFSRYFSDDSAGDGYWILVRISIL